MKLLKLFRRCRQDHARDRSIVASVNQRIEMERAKAAAERQLREERGNLRQTAQIIGSHSRRVVALSNAMSLVRDDR